MKVGLLLCDHVGERFRPITGGDYDHLFYHLLPELDWQVYDLTQEQFPDHIDDCAAYVCSGSVHSVYEDIPWILRLKSFVRDLYDRHKPLVGVCFGHQMLAEALGGKVGKGACGWCVGVHTFEVVHPENWMKPRQMEFNLLMSCQDQVLALPPDSTILARTADCSVSMFRVGDQMLGLQAHPEFTKGYAQALLEVRRERIGAGRVEAAVGSLEMGLDGGLMGKWIKQFLGR